MYFVDVFRFSNSQIFFHRKFIKPTSSFSVCECMLSFFCCCCLLYLIYVPFYALDIFFVSLPRLSSIYLSNTLGTSVSNLNATKSNNSVYFSPLHSFPSSEIRFKFVRYRNMVHIGVWHPHTALIKMYMR